MARHLGLPDEIVQQRPPPPTPTALRRARTNFTSCLPYPEMDLPTWAKNHGVPAAEAAPVMNFEAVQVERVYKDIDRKRATTLPLHLTSLLVKEVPEIRKVSK